MEMKCIFFRVAFRKEVQDRVPRSGNLNGGNAAAGGHHVLHVTSLKQSVDPRDRVSCSLPVAVMKEHLPNMVMWCGRGRIFFSRFLIFFQLRSLMLRWMLWWRC
jgi:hypothetical protein